jgi:hypothetical protein
MSIRRRLSPAGGPAEGAWGSLGVLCCWPLEHGHTLARPRAGSAARARPLPRQMTVATAADDRPLARQMTGRYRGNDGVSTLAETAHLPAPHQVGHHVVHLGIGAVVAVRDMQTETEVSRIRHGYRRPATPPARPGKDANLTHSGRPKARSPGDGRRGHQGTPCLGAAAQLACDHGPVSALGSFGRPRTISPRMLRCTCEVPA